MRQWAMFAALLSVCALVHADSLYSPNSGFGTLFSSRKAARIGDVLHVIITESAQASQNMANTNDVTTDSKLGPGVGKLSFLPLVGYGGSSSSQSKGTTNRSENFIGRIAVTVMGYSPTGNLLIEGERLVVVHKDQQIIKVLGEVRPQDVTAESTVPSYKVANARISYTGSDPLRPGAKVGIVTRLLHWLF